jgi:hypothetical protein
MASKFDILGLFVTNGILSEIFSQLLSLQDICQFDSAMCNKNRRNVFLEFIRSEYCIFLGNKDRNFSSNAISWLHTLSIKIRHLNCDLITDEISSKIGDMGSCLYWISLKDGNMKENASGFQRDRKNVPKTYNLRDTINPDNKSLRLIKEVLPTRIIWPPEYYRYYTYMYI